MQGVHWSSNWSGGQDVPEAATQGSHLAFPPLEQVGVDDCKKGGGIVGKDCIHCVGLPTRTVDSLHKGRKTSGSRLLKRLQLFNRRAMRPPSLYGGEG